MDKAADISLFLRVFDAGSISAAARSLDLSVAVASQRLKRLEAGLGVRLFQRTTRQLHPTPEGLALAEQGRALIDDLEALTASLREAGMGIAGTLRLTTSALIARRLASNRRLLCASPEYMRRHGVPATPQDLALHQCLVLMGRSGRGLRSGEAAKVMGVTELTVAGYVKAIYRKLNICSRAEAALEAQKRGLV